MPDLLPALPVIIPLAGAALLAGLTKLTPAWLSSLLTIAATTLSGYACAALLRRSAAETIVYWFGAWRPRNLIGFGISFTIDPLGAGLALFACLLTLMAVIFSLQYFDSAGNHFHALLLAFLGAMCGFCLTGDLFNLFVFFELMSAAAFALCGYKTEDPGTLQGALNFAVTNTIAAYLVLTGIALLYARTGGLNMAQIGRALAQQQADRLILGAFALIVCGYLVKASVVPFHFWLADAHSVAPTPVCVLFSGVMVALGLYAVARIYWTVFGQVLGAHQQHLRLLIVGFGVVTALVGACMCYLQRNLKRLLAFSTVSHVGLMVMGIGLFTPAGIAGVAVYLFGHGLAKGSLFLASGMLLHRFESVDEMELHGRGRQTLWIVLPFVLGAAALAGTPFSAVSLAEEQLRVAGRPFTFYPGWISFPVGVLTAGAVLRAAARIFLGWGAKEPALRDGSPENKEQPETRGPKTTPAAMYAPALALALAAVVSGVWPGLAWSLPAAQRFADTAGYQAHVLEQALLPPLGPPPAAPLHVSWSGLLVFASSLLLAAAHLVRSKPKSRPPLLPLRWLHGLHSGHVGDYVAFLTLGVALFGIICLYWAQ